MRHFILITSLVSLGFSMSLFAAEEPVNHVRINGAFCDFQTAVARASLPLSAKELQKFQEGKGHTEINVHYLNTGSIQSNYRAIQDLGERYVRRLAADLPGFKDLGARAPEGDRYFQDVNFDYRVLRNKIILGTVYNALNGMIVVFNFRVHDVSYNEAMQIEIPPHATTLPHFTKPVREKAGSVHSLPFALSVYQDPITKEPLRIPIYNAKVLKVYTGP